MKSCLKKQAANFRLFHLPLWGITIITNIMLAFANGLCIEPLIPPGEIIRSKQNRLLSGGKTAQNHGCLITPVRKGFSKTLTMLKKSRQ